MCFHLALGTFQRPSLGMGAIRIFLVLGFSSLSVNYKTKLIYSLSYAQRMVLVHATLPKVGVLKAVPLATKAYANLGCTKRYRHKGLYSGGHVPQALSEDSSDTGQNTSLTHRDQGLHLMLWQV